ncbi:choline/ethanolamine transporter flvcr2a-like [Leptinotarsa decemlineata]|uniref:choline/ethanolamine transporter flvcr2a-like n=1 Tax=Leptinotarsa decemlineata TaxID=7539 RepID=UPI003D305C30
MDANDLEDEKIQPTIEVYRERWIILMIYILCTCLSSTQWIEYSIITNVVMKYYDVSASTVDWTSMSFAIMWPILVFPASYIIDKMGLRVAVLIGILSTALGSGVKVFSVGENSFYVVILGQLIVAASQIFLLNLPSKLSVVWFKPEEISTVCSLGILGLTSGTAISYFVPPIMVRDSDNMDEVADDFRVMNWGVFLLSIPLVLIVFFYFPERPLNPPSMAMFEKRNQRNEVTVSSFMKSFKLLMNNKAFHVHNIAFGCNLGIFSVIGTLMNQCVLNYFPGAQEDAGRMGSLMIIAGIGGSVFTGIILDKTHRYKETSSIVSLLETIVLAGVLYALSAQNKWLSYTIITVFGIFQSAYLPAGVEFGMEITYPSPESTVLGILYATSQIITVVLTIIFGQIIGKFGAFWVLTGMIITLALGTTLSIMTPNELKRQTFFEIHNRVKFTQVPQHDNDNVI